MKKILIIFVIFSLFLFLFLYIVKNYHSVDNNTESYEQTSETAVQLETNLVKDSDKDYIISAVFSAMPASYEEEALKAQALIAQTELIERRMNGESTENLEENILSKDDLKAMYTDYFDECYDKISSAADYAYKKCICYEGVPIRPYYHGESSGKTDSAESLCDTFIPYLSGVNSPYDTYSEEKIFTESEISARLYAYFTDESFKNIKSTDIKIKSQTESKAVKSVICGEKELSGFDFVKILSLPSVCFDIEYEDNKLKITSYGAGNNLGLSENGANVMAKEGYTSEEIIKYYFSGVTITEFT